ncbi:MAG: DoxX family protein [Nanoarchaeota archaeon]|nr:DoxX family protein [Nanoarchaeota archaeon]|tara:strand:+ start:630 stop:1052 length:423 start_codon:yes stop_codon:yes gene_type:complete
MFDKQLAKYSDYSIFLVRIGVGIIFLSHGIGKLLNIGPFAIGTSNFAGFLNSMGVPIAIVVAWIVTLVETFGGLAILAGFKTRLAALLVSINIGIAIILVHLKNGLNSANGGFEFVLLLFLASLAIAFKGAGKKFKLDKE